MDENALLLFYSKIHYLIVFSSTSLMWDFLVRLWTSSCFPLASCSQPWIDSSGITIGSTGGEIKDFPWHRLRDFLSTNVALSSPVLIDSIVPIVKIWKSFPEFAGVVKPCTAGCWKNCYCCKRWSPFHLVYFPDRYSDFSRNFLHSVFVFCAFCCGRISVMSFESLDAPKKS